jgi:hypothetical protein
MLAVANHFGVILVIHVEVKVQLPRQAHGPLVVESADQHGRLPAQIGQ